MKSTAAKPRILWVANWRVKGGISIVTERFMRDESVQSQYVVRVQDQSFPGEINEHPVVKALKLPRGVMLVLWNCLRFKPDIVHIHTPYDRFGFIKDGLMVILSKILGKKVVLTFHPGFSLSDAYRSAPAWLKTWTDFVLPRCNVLVALGNSYREFLAEEFHHPCVVVIPNSVDDDMAANAPNDYAQRAPIAFYAGLFTPRKGAFDFIQAAEKVKLESAQFNIKGSSRTPAETRQMEEIYQASRARDRIHFEEWGPVFDLMNRARVLVLPSYGESLPVILVEALACGLPVITTPVGVIPDYIQDGVHGLLIEPGDINGLANAIETVLTNLDWAAQVAQSNREYGKMFLRSRVHALLMQVYDRLLEA